MQASNPQNDFVSLRKKLDAAMAVDWRLPNPGNRELDPTRVEQYLQKLTPEDQTAIKLLLENTKYINFSEFYSALMRSLASFVASVSKNEPLYLVYPKKFGSDWSATDRPAGTPAAGGCSEHWIIQLLWPVLREYNILGIINSSNVPISPTGKIHILFVDDAIYTGNNFLGSIDEYTDSVAQKFGVRSAILHQQYNVVVECLVPYLSTCGYEQIVGMSRSLSFITNFHCAERLKSFRNILTDLDQHKRFYSRFECEGWPCPVYFDHKVANNFGSFPQIYLHGYIPVNDNQTQKGEEFGCLLKNPPSRAIIVQLEQFYNDLKD